METFEGFKDLLHRFIQYRDEKNQVIPAQALGVEAFTPVWAFDQANPQAYYRDDRLTFAILASRDPSPLPPYPGLQWCISSAHLEYVEDRWLKLPMNCRLVELQAPLPIEKPKSCLSSVLLSRDFPDSCTHWVLPCTQRPSSEK